MTLVAVYATDGAFVRRSSADRSVRRSGERRNPLSCPSLAAFGFAARFRRPQRPPSYFSLCRQRKVTKRKATPMWRSR